MKNFLRSSQISKKDFLRSLTFFSVFGFIAFLIFNVENLLTSFILALVMNFMLSPVINVLERHGIRRLHSIIGTFVLLTALFFIALVTLYPFLAQQMSILKVEIPVYWDKMVVQIDNLQYKMLQTWVFKDTNIFDFVKGSSIKTASTLLEKLPNIFSKSLTTLVLAPFLCFFMLKDGQKVLKVLYTLAPNRIFELSLSLHSQITFQIGQFIRSRLVASFFVGLVVWVGLFIQKTPLSFPLAVFAGLANLIPYIGPVLSVVPALIVGFVTGFAPLQFVQLLAPYVLAQVIDGLFILPFIVARLVDLHPVTILISLIIGAQVLGVLGMLVAIPVAFTCKLILSTIYRHMIGVH